MAQNLWNLAIDFDDDDLMDHLVFNSDSQSSYNREWNRFDLETMLDQQILNNFRFAREDLPILCAALQVPARIVFADRSVASGEEALCVVLRRLAYPCRLCDLEPIFGRPKSVLSTVINETIDFLDDKWQHLLTDVDLPWLDQAHLETYSHAVEARGAPLDNCIGFIDGTVRPLCRPGRLQREVFNGHKRCHAIKFQSVVVPNGLVVNLFGPFSGRRHDCALLNESNMFQKLEQLPLSPDGRKYALYGDPAYPVREQLLCPFRGAQITPEQRTFNGRMSSVRESVEWMFGKIIQEFAFLDYKKNLKLFLQPVGKYYRIGALLTNCHTCLYGSITSTYFDLNPPELENYLVEKE